MNFKYIHEFGALSDPLMGGKRYEAEVRWMVVEHWTSCQAEAAAGADEQQLTILASGGQKE